MGVKAKIALSVAIMATLLTSAAGAAEPESCKKVRLSDVGWTDIQVTTAVTSNLLSALGYEPEIVQLTVPVTYASMKAKDIDVFLGNWMPAQTAVIKEYSNEGSVETVAQNLEGAGFGLVVPEYVAAAGVKTLADLGKFKEKFDGKIYGIEAGAAGNENIQKLIDDPNRNLAGFELVQSSEAGMLTEAEKAIKDDEWIVFLGWTPHPIMGEMKIKYLGGMENSGFGEAKVFTTTRQQYSAECPNVGAFLKNLKFALPMENAMMGQVLAGQNADDVAKEWLKTNPKAIEPWLEGVTAFDGGDAGAAVDTALKD